MRLTPPIAKRLADPAAEESRRSQHDAIVQLQSLPLASARVIRNVQLTDGVVTRVAHGLGRAPIFFVCSPPRLAAATGRIMDYRDSTIDMSITLALQATGWGATIYVDVLVF